MALIKLNNQSLSAVTSAGLPSGTVLQVQYFSSTTVAQSSSTTYVDFISGTITPSSASSKILCLVSTQLYIITNNSARAALNLLRDSTLIHNIHNAASFGIGTSINGFRTASFSYLDSPSTTSQITYKGQMNRASFNSTYGSTFECNDHNMTLMEIAG
jgi:hypothetical protein